jgi:hypothetical protein
MVTVKDIESALKEVRPALGKQDEALKLRFPLGISPYSPSIERVMRDLERFTYPSISKSPQTQSILLVGASGGGCGVSALAARTASFASTEGRADYVRFITALDLVTAGDGSGEEARAAALMERFAEARELPHSLLVLDDVDQLCAGVGPNGYSPVLLGTLRALLRTPSTRIVQSDDSTSIEPSTAVSGAGRTMKVVAATSRSDAAFDILHEIFDETVVVPPLQDSGSVATLLSECFDLQAGHAAAFAEMIIDRIGDIGVKTALRLMERAILAAGSESTVNEQLKSLWEVIDDLTLDEELRLRADLPVSTKLRPK